MNKNCYKIIFSKHLGTLVAVGEHTTSTGKAASGQGCRGSVVVDGFVGALRFIFASVAIACLSLGNTQAQSTLALASNALPQGGNVNTGAATISTHGAAMAITQTTDKASINWQSFNVGTGASVNIAQPDANSVLLNRVVGNDPSQILGKLTANGQVILLNPNGVVFGKDGSVTASAFTASTFALTDADFMAGYYKYTRNGSTAAVVNQGTIETSAGGFVALIGATVTNEGTIRAPQGDVVLAAAESVTLPNELVKPQAPATPNTVSVRMSKRVRLELDPAAINTAVNNTESGVIVTEGGQVLLQAAAISSAVASVTHSGRIDTSAPQAGAVTVLADNGTIKIDGHITANSTDTTNKGGDIIIGRDEVTHVLAATTDVSNAKLESNIGFVETSGEQLKFDSISVVAKDWLLDPVNVNIDAASATTIGANLSTTNVTIQTTGTTPGVTSAGTGNITVSSAITKAAGAGADTTLTLLADNGITVNAAIGAATGAGKLNVVMTANGQTDGVAVGSMTAAQRALSQGLLINNTSINANGGNITLTGTSYADNTTYNATTLTGNPNLTTGNLSATTALGKGVQIHNGSTLTGNNITITGTAQNQAGESSYGVDFQRYATQQTLTATGDISITGTLNGAGNGSGIGFYTSGWGAQAAMITAGGKFTLRANNRASTSNASATLDVTEGMQVKAGGDIVIQAETNNAAANAIKLYSGAATTWGTALQGNTSFRSVDSSGNASGNVLIQANQGSISLNNLVTSTLTNGSLTALTDISGKNVTIDNTGAGMVTGVGNTVGSGSITTDATTGAVTLVAGSGKATSLSTQAVLINDGRAINASNNLNIAGASTGNVGIQTNGVLTGGTVNLAGASDSSIGVYMTATGASLNATSGDVTISGTAGNTSTNTALNLVGSISAHQNVTLSGTNTNSANTTAAIYLNNTVTATNGTIDITADTSGSSAQVLQLNSSAALNTTNHAITLTADSLSITNTTTINAGTSTVTLKNKNAGVQIAVGGNDSGNTTLASRTLGLTNAEINRISAGNLVIGSNTAGNTTVSAATTTTATTGNLSLVSGGNITVNAALTVGDAAATKNLTLNGAGTTSAISQTAAIKANNLELLGSNASYTLNNTSNDVSTLAANVKSMAYTDATALTIGTVNSTTGITATGDISVKTATGDLTLSQNIATNNANTVNLEAASAIAQTAGTISAGTLNLKAGTTIGSSSNRVHTSVSNLSLNSAGDQYITEADSVNVSGQTTSNGNIDIATTDGTLGVGASVNSIVGLSASGTGNISLTGYATGNTNSAVSISSTVTSSGGNVTLAGHSVNGSGIYISNAGSVTANSGTATLNGTSDANNRPVSSAYAGLVNAGAVSAQTIAITAQATNTSADVLGYYGAGGSLTASGSLTVTGNSAGSGNGFYSFGGSLNAGNGITLNGTSAHGQGLGLEQQGTGGSNATLTNTGGSGISLTGTATDTSKQGAALNGVTIENRSGNLSITASSGSLDANTTHTVTGDGKFGGSNTITSTATAGTVLLKAGSTSSDSGTVDGSNLTITQSANASITVQTTGTGNVTAPKIVNNGTGNVVVAAGSGIAAGTTAGGNVLTVSGNTITQSSTGKTYIYTGSAAATGALGNLSTNYTSLYYNGSSHTLNAAFNSAYNSTITSGASNQVLFRETSTPSFTLDLVSATVHKTYGQTDPTLASVISAEQTAYTAASKPATLNTTVAGAGGNNTFSLAAADAFSALTGSRATGENVANGPYAYTLSVSGLNTTVTGTSPTLTIDKATLSASLIGNTSKQYDGLTNATLTSSNYSLTGWVGSEGATVSQTAGTYASPNVSANGGSGTVSATLTSANFTANSGTSLSNYILPTSASGNIGAITAAPLIIKVNNTSAFVTQDARNATDQGFSYTGFKNGETELTALTGSYTRTYSNSGNNTPVVGTYTGVYGLSATPTAVNGNYTITVQNGNLTVVPADKLLITIGSQSDAYGNRTATNGGAAGTGTVTAEYCFNQSLACSGANVVQLNMTKLSGTEWKAADSTGSYVVFDTGLTTPAYSTGGYLNAGNYTYTATEITPLSLPNGNFVGRATNGGVLTITPASLTLSASGINKTYDGSTAATGAAISAANAFTGDDVSALAATGAYAGANVGSGNVTLGGLSLAGADAVNYSLASTSLTGTGSITAKQLTLAGLTVANKTYDGTTTASITSNGTLQGLVGNETLTLSNLSATFASATVGNNKTVNITAALTDGTGLASNYSLTNPSVFANITAVNNGGNNQPQPYIKPPSPVIPDSNNSGGGNGGSGSASGNPYVVIPNNTQSTNCCTANNLEACLCEDQPNAPVSDLAICYEPKKADNAPAKPTKQKQAALLISNKG